MLLLGLSEIYQAKIAILLSHFARYINNIYIYIYKIYKLNNNIVQHVTMYLIEVYFCSDYFLKKYTVHNIANIIKNMDMMCPRYSNWLKKKVTKT